MHSVGNGNRAVVYDGKIAGLYDLEETLGSGHFAVVKLARHVFTGEKVAVKVIDKTKLDEVSRAHLFQEVRCMKLVQHPNVVRLYEVIDTQTKLYLILELGDGGDLYDYIMKHEGGLSENLAREYFRQIVRAISYCHQLHVVHRDLKPENVVFFEKLGVVKLTDFGFSNKFCPGQKLETSCGSLAYSAPEILLGDSYDAPAVDIWSLGVILYMLVCGQPPFEKANDSETLTMIMDCKYTMPAHVSSGCRKLIASMLVREPEKRATLDQIAQNSWLIQGAQQEIVPEYLPLVSRQQVSDDDHTLIIQRMVNGNIATKEEILDALDRNEYNHITATYFLLAERKLRQQRQEQLQKRRPELSLPVSSSARSSPRTRMQGMNRDQKSPMDTNNLLVPTSSQLCAPRTPGAETGGRSRKCSIVQEEDDEDEITGCNSRDELSTPLNRRGSRSEGRINIAIQDRVAENERLKKDVSSNVQSKGLEDICGIKRINKDTNNVRLRLGIAGNSRNNIENKTSVEKCSSSKIELGERSNSVDQSFSGKQSQNTNIIHTKVLIDSSTITIPLSSHSSGQSEAQSNAHPKYKTMPSPTRPSIILSGPRALNEIFEEGTDIGSSDSATTTPRPLVRNAHFTTHRTPNNPVATQRRSKFHKTRTPSCSSSDASDDDSESRKKRAHKINDSPKPLYPQRRDSHDDSSDSQDQGPAQTSTGGNNTSFLICSTNVGTSNNTVQGGKGTQQQQQQKQQQQQQQTREGSSSSSSNGRQKTEQQQQPITFRRHRTGRRRAGETRLRESQSLNRITEVQESELPVINSSHSNTNNLQNSNSNNASATTTAAAVSSKPKGFSARLFHGFIRKNDVIQQQQSPTVEKLSSASKDSQPTEDVDLVLGEFKKAIRVTESKSSSATKKLKMLGRYFQVHKKICIPLPGLFQRGRLYKAQSCGSIVRDKINPNVHSSTAQNTRHSVLFTEKGKILRNCLGARFLGSSDGDINQNNGKTNLQHSMLFTMPTTAQSCNLPAKKSSPLHQIGDVPLCSSKC